MRFNFSKAWCAKAAALEKDHNVSAGALMTTRIDLDYQAVYGSVAHRLMSARVFLQQNNTSAAQTLLNECAEIIRQVESPGFLVCHPNPQRAESAAGEAT